MKTHRLMWRLLTRPTIAAPPQPPELPPIEEKEYRPTQTPQQPDLQARSSAHWQGALLKSFSASKLDEAERLLTEVAALLRNRIKEASRPQREHAVVASRGQLQ
jgi:hypothetical protein